MVEEKKEIKNEISNNLRTGADDTLFSIFILKLQKPVKYTHVEIIKQKDVIASKRLLVIKKSIVVRTRIKRMMRDIFLP
ncbi:MAG: hypothetical protein QW087_07685 [Methanomassiliicoccales archaeon]